VPGENLPEIVRSLIVRHLDSVLEVEILLLLYGSRPRAWSAEEVVENLRIDRAWAATLLGKLCDAGLLRCDAANQTYAYGPASAQLEAAVAALDAAYAARRVRVIELIFAKPLEKIRSFADAFRIRAREKDKETPDGG
jgi:predicted transcriptional regulator